jgi:hypothetical protein
MSKFIWLPEHCEQLQSLRIAAGIDISTLASNHSLSKMQIKQLEEGGESAFYTPEIKFTVGRKLIRSFGVEVVHIEPKEEAIESDLFAVVAELPAPLAEGVAHTKLTKILESFNFRGSINYFYLICFGVTLIALFFFLSQWTASMKKDFVKEKNAPHTEQIPVFPLSVESDKGLPSTVKMNNINLSTECDWDTRSIQKIAPNPIKPGNYVHLVASDSVSVCVMDHANEVKTLSFKPMEAKTIHGQPPFKIFSHEFSKLKLYYQGNLIRITEPFPEQIFLNEKS